MIPVYPRRHCVLRERKNNSSITVGVRDTKLFEFDTFTRNNQVQGKTILKSEGADTSKLRFAQLQYMTNYDTNFRKDRSKTVGLCDKTFIELDKCLKKWLSSRGDNS